MTGTQTTIKNNAGPVTPQSRSGGGWTEQMFEEAKRLAGEKKTARQISEAIGISRSAVICKLKRAEIALGHAPAGGPGISRKGITKGEGYRATGKAPRPRKRNQSDGVGTTDTDGVIQTRSQRSDFDGRAPGSSFAVGLGEFGSQGNLSVRGRSNIIVVGLDENTDWEPDRITMARQLIEDKSFSIAESARQMGVPASEMKRICAKHNIRQGGFNAMRMVRQAEMLPTLVAKETPSAIDMLAQKRSIAGLDTLFNEASSDRPKGEPVSILDLRASDCRYIVGKDSIGLAAYCGHQSVANKSYCREHCARVFEVARKRD